MCPLKSGWRPPSSSHSHFMGFSQIISFAVTLPFLSDETVATLNFRILLLFLLSRMWQDQISPLLPISSLIFFFLHEVFSTIKSLQGCSYIIFKVTVIITESISLSSSALMEMKMPQQGFFFFLQDFAAAHIICKTRSMNDEAIFRPTALSCLYLQFFFFPCKMEAKGMQF